MRGCDLSRLHDGQIGGLLILENANRAIERGLPEHAQFGTYPFFVRLSDKSSAAQIVCEICPLSPREIFVALVSVLDNLAVGLIIVPVVYLGVCILLGIKYVIFELFRALIQEREQGKLNLQRPMNGLVPRPAVLRP
jgi:hypothetical protein